MQGRGNPRKSSQPLTDILPRLEWGYMRHLGQECINNTVQKLCERDISDQVLQACLKLWQDVQPGYSGHIESSIVIEQLLQSSLDLGLRDGEITPVQVWDTIRSLPVLESVSVQTMGQVTAELCQHVKHEG